VRKSCQELHYMAACSMCTWDHPLDSRRDVATCRQSLA
jgi:hypothetical protein